MSNKNPIQTWLIPFLKFNLVGILNTLIDNGLYYLFHSVLGWHFALAKTLSYATATLNSWLWNSRWTFAVQKGQSAVEKGKQGGQFLRFLLVNAAAYLSQLGVLWLCRHIWGSSSLWMSLFLATPASMLVNFLGNRLFVFKRDQERD